jgi:hypothetical protein
MDDITNGTSHIIQATESLENRFARWTVGAEATVVGLPPIVEFEECTALFGGDRKLCTPKGYKDAFKNNPEANSIYWTYHTYLDWNYDKTPYDGFDGAQNGKYGPSSNHTEIVNHLFCDGSCRSIKKDADVNLYRSHITPRLERF